MGDWQKNDGWTVDQKVLKKIDFHHIMTQKDPNAPKDTQKDTEKDTEKGTESAGTETESTESGATETEDGTDK